jgi:TonB family protein
VADNYAYFPSNRAGQKMKTLVIIIAAGVLAATSLGSEKNPNVTARAIYSPRPDYPVEARRSNITGAGVVLVRVNAAGIVTSAVMAQSTGSPLLDLAATSCFKRWRFKPGPAFTWRTPISFSSSR